MKLSSSELSKLSDHCVHKWIKGLTPQCFFKDPHRENLVTHQCHWVQCLECGAQDKVLSWVHPDFKSKDI